jgi:hypothetical protein
MMEYMHKYQEALQSLQKKVGLVDEMQQENLKIHQLNLTLTGELEDYRHQTKRLLTDLRQKEEEIATLKVELESKRDAKRECPLCNVAVGDGDQLQLHYLTSCTGYSGHDGGVASSSRARDPSPPAAATSSGATSGGGAPGNRRLVQFMWHPLTQISYPKVTLLTSFEPGSVDLSIDPEGGHYYSEQVSVPSGRYEGQLVIGDSFIHPVKEFAVDTGSGGIVALEFEKRGTAIRADSAEV